MRCPRCYKEKKKDKNTKTYPQMELRHGKHRDLWVCKLCGYTLLVD